MYSNFMHNQKKGRMKFPQTVGAYVLLSVARNWNWNWNHKSKALGISTVKVQVKEG